MLPRPVVEVSAGRVSRVPEQIRMRFGPAAFLAVATIIATSCSNGPSDPPLADRILWKHSRVGVNILPSMSADMVYFGSRGHELVALLKSDGSVRWVASTSVSGDRTAGFNTVVSGEIVALGDIDVFAFDRTTGALRWMFRPPDDDETGTNWLGADDQTVYAPSLWGRVYAVDAATGMLRWRAVMPGSSNSGPSSTKTFRPTHRNGIVYVGIKRFMTPPSGGIAALDAGTGLVKWIREFEPGYPGAAHGSLGIGAFHGANVIVAAEDGRIYSLNAESGAVNWIAPWVHIIPPDPRGGYADDRMLTVVGNVIVASSNTGPLVGLNASTGSELWRRTTGFGSAAYPFLSTDGSVAFLTTAGGELHAIDPLTGNSLWHAGGAQVSGGTYVGGEFASPPLVDGSRLFVPGYTGFYALSKD